VRFGGRTVELFPTPLLVAEFGPILEPEGSLLADIDGDGEEAEELIPFVWIPGGTGRFIFEDTGWVVVADGAIFISARRKPNPETSPSATRSLRNPPSLSVICSCSVHLMEFKLLGG
jgi:hypothetical protein